MHARTVLNAFFARLNLAEFLGMAALLVVGFLLVGSGEGSIGGTTAAMLLFLRLFGPINELLIVIDELQSALASLSRIVGASLSGDDAAARSEHRVSDDAGIRVERLSHSYVDGHPTLEDVDVLVPVGTTTALVGASGAGKTTLGALIAGIHRPRTGTIDAPEDVVLVTQDVHVFETSLRENLTLARPDADDRDLRAALAVAGAAPLLARLADGLDEQIHPGSLSPAEAQQVALARVVLADPAAVVLDEATAEAGSSDADRLEEAALRVVRGRTALMIAHRLSQAEAADHVVVLAHGRVREQGTHESLLAADGEYAQLWNAWHER
jgi:ATP-binding cassette subfamily C protein